MKTRICLLTAAMIGFGTQSGSERTPQPPATSETPSEVRDETSDYPITGRVTAVAPDKKAVTLDHEDIPGLMKAMEMEFVVEDPQILEEIEAANDVRGRLKVDDGKYIITELRKQ